MRCTGIPGFDPGIGVVAAQGAQHAYRLKRMLTDGTDENGEIVIPERVCVALAPLAAQIDALDQAIAAIDDKLIETIKADEKARHPRGAAAHPGDEGGLSPLCMKI
jgi:hypothetical protein